MNEQVDRLWRILLKNGAFDALTTITPNLKDSLFVQLLLEASTSEKRFRFCISPNRALLEWASEKNDAELSYLIWLQRGQHAA